MKFKKYVGVTLIGILTVAMVGCSTPKSKNVEGASATKIEEDKETSTTEKSTNVEDSIKKEIVLVDDDIAKIVLTEKVNDEIFGPTYNFLIENKSDAKIIVQSRDTSIDGVMQEPIFSVEVMPDKKAKGEMTIFNYGIRQAPFFRCGESIPFLFLQRKNKNTERFLIVFIKGLESVLSIVV